MKKYKINIDIYKVVLEIWVGGTEKEFCEKISKLEEDINIIEDGCLGMYITIYENKNKNKVKTRIIWIGEKDKYILYHEIFHAVCAIMSYKNIHFVEDMKRNYVVAPEEAYAYLFEFLIKEADKKLKNIKL